MQVIAIFQQQLCNVHCHEENIIDLSEKWVFLPSMNLLIPTIS